MTGWEPKGSESSLPVWKPTPAPKPAEPDPTPIPYWPFPKVDLDVGGVID